MAEKKNQIIKDEEQVVVRVKVKPYPIDCDMVKVEGQPPMKVKIVRVEDFGFLFKVVNHLFRPGETYTCRFELPVLAEIISGHVKIIKTYESLEQYVADGAKERVLTVEAHFTDLPVELKSVIKNFLRQIGQKKV
jgi:hypothetical protein